MTSIFIHPSQSELARKIPSFNDNIFSLFSPNQNKTRWCEEFLSSHQRIKRSFIKFHLTALLRDNISVRKADQTQTHQYGSNQQHSKNDGEGYHDTGVNPRKWRKSENIIANRPNLP